MNRPDRSEAEAMADRCVNYADALAAIVYLGVSGFGIAIADPDIRGSMNLVSGWLIFGNVAFCSGISLLLVLLRRWELDLRGGEAGDARVRRYALYFYIARHCVVWLAVVQIVGLLMVSSLDLR
ncbi:MAG: hypothetical protein R3228_08085 [Halioglobus sp.]|nr:hypothetical protein [Halioglobus sp.]